MLYTPTHNEELSVCGFFVSVIFASWLMSRVEARAEEAQDLR